MQCINKLYLYNLWGDRDHCREYRQPIAQVGEAYIYSPWLGQPNWPNVNWTLRKKTVKMKERENHFDKMTKAREFIPGGPLKNRPFHKEFLGPNSTAVKIRMVYFNLDF